MNIPQVVENFTVAEEQFAENGQSQTIAEAAHAIASLETNDLAPLVELMIRDGGLPPSPRTPVSAEDVVASMLRGLLIGIRAVQLTELSELENIPTLDE